MFLQEALGAFWQKTHIKLQKYLPFNLLIHVHVAVTTGQSRIQGNSNAPQPTSRANTGVTRVQDPFQVSQS